MQLLTGLLSLKEFTELALSFKEWAENKQLFTYKGSVSSEGEPTEPLEYQPEQK